MTPPARTASTTDRVVDAVWRMESARIVSALTRVTGDVGLAEELAQDAMVAALERWPATGVPAKPGAWLMATAKHRAIDLFRRSERLERKTAELGRELTEAEEPDWAAALDEVVEDDVLRLVFISCHPVLSREEVIEWVRKAPFRDAEIEIRQVASAEDFGDNMTPELREQEDRLRATTAAQHES